MNFILNEEVVRKALLLELEERMTAIPAAYYEPHCFTKRFEQKMKRLLKRAQRPPALDYTIRFSKRAAIALLAALLASFTTVMSVAAWRESFFRFVEQKFREYSIVSYEPINSNSNFDDPSKFIAYSPTYIPDSFRLVNEIWRGRVQLRYEGANNTYITYRQVKLGETELRINTEGVDMQAVEFNGYNAYYYSNLGSHSLFWDDGIYSYVVSSNIDKNTVIEIAESIKIKEN